ncbi:MAG TPA: hypothetical protein DD417_10275 [Elusimicrobia bacterium]|nr:hypothetical protein [Elusimicrobiota bacterium]
MKRLIAICLLMAFASRAFASELDDIRAAIAKHGAKWTAGETSVSVLSPEQRKSYLGSAAPNRLNPRSRVLARPAARVGSFRAAASASPATTLPRTLDWRNYNGRNYVTPIKRQNGGGCWAFAAAAGLESYVLRTQNQPGLNLDISEQIALCNASFIFVDDFLQVWGLPLEAAYPYVGQSDCANAAPGWENGAYRIGAYAKVEKTVEAMREALAAYGPLQIDMMVHADFLSYKTGIYSRTIDVPIGGHRVLIVGYDDVTQSFIAKNSWGTAWGMSGFFQFAYSGLTDWTNTGGGVFVAPVAYAATDVTTLDIAIANPIDNAAVFGVVPLAGSASVNSYNVVVTKVDVQVDDGPFMPADGTQNWSYSLNTASLSIRSHTITVRAMDSTGNSVKAAITVAVRPPDLAMTDLTGPAAAAPGSIVAIAERAANQGNSGVRGAVGPFPVGVYLSQDPVITTADTLLYSRIVNGLAAGTSSIGQENVALPANLSEGTYYLGAIADYAGVIQESDETNNATAGKPVVVVRKPDLAVALVSGPSTALPGGNIFLTSRVTNNGTASTGFYVGVYLSTTPFIDTGNLKLGEANVGGLPANGAAEVYLTVKLPENLLPGTYYLDAIVDNTGIVAEFDETNNIRGGNSITIIPDTILPTVSVSIPDGPAFGVISVNASASDNIRVTGVQFQLDGVNQGAEITSPPYAFSWDTTLTGNGTHILTAVARDPAGNRAAYSLGKSVTNTLAQRNPTLGIPLCLGTGINCTSGSLLRGRGAAESNAPNTIHLWGTPVSCADGTFPGYGSIEQITVSAVDGAALSPGKPAKIQVVTRSVSAAWAYKLDIFYTADAMSYYPTWTPLAHFDSTLSQSGDQTFSTTYTLPVGGIQAVRASYRWGNNNSTLSCSNDGGGYLDDHDDLAFGVGVNYAVFDPALKAPKCLSAGSSCDSGGLLTGRGTLSGGVEPEFTRPNNIYASCADGNAGTFHSDESLDRLRVSSLDGGPLTAGKAAKIEAAVWAWAGYSADKLDLYYAADANSPRWTFLTTLTPATSGQQTLSTTYTLPYDGTALQAVRANFRYYGSASACTAGSFDDHDDLVFAAVRGGATPAGSGGSAAASRELPPLPPLTAAQKASAQSSGLVLIGRTLDAPGSGARDGAVDSETIPAERREGVGERPRTLSAPVTIGFPYRESDLPEGVKEADLRLYVWQPEEGRWVEAAQARQDPERDEFELTTNQPGDYRIFARDPGPSPQAAFGLGEVYAYPNPARGGVRPVIRAELGVAEKVEIKIYNLAGELVHAAELASVPALIGGRYVYEYPWDASRNPSGVYIYVVRAWQGGQAVKAAKKLALIK